jgi:MFS family permease
MGGRAPDQAEAFVAQQTRVADGALARVVAAFRIDGYANFWLSSAASALAWSASTVALGWMTLLVSGSPFAVGAVYAARVAPALVVGIPFGALGERWGRKRMLVTANLLAALLLVTASALAFNGSMTLPVLIVAALLLGTVEALRGTIAQSHAYDLAGPDGSTNAIALTNLASLSVGAIGGLAAGISLERVGPGATFLLAAIGSLVGAAILATSRHVARFRGRRVDPDIRSSMTLILRNERVRVIAALVVMAEILGFSSVSVLPTLARDVLGGDASALGAMTAARAIGGGCGVLLLAGLGLQGRGGRMMITTATVFGLSLVGLAASGGLLLACIALLVVGATGSALDTLGQTLVQRAVSDHERSSAMGIWTFAIGFGPIGILLMGAAAVSVGAPAALAASGALMTAGAVTIGSVTPLRELD